MTDYLRHLAAKDLNLEKGIAPRVPAFFEPASFTGGACDGGYYLEQDSFSDKQKVFFESKTKGLHDETEHDRIEYDETEKPIDGISFQRTHLGPSISRDASTEASDQSPISGQLEGGRISGFFPPIYAEPHIRFKNAGQRPRSFGTRKSKYILTNKGVAASRQIEPLQSDLPSSRIAGKTPGVNASRYELELKQRAYDLGKSQMAYHSHMHKPDLPGARREPYRRVRWEATYAHQQHQDSVEISDHPKKRTIQARAGRYDGPEAQRTEVPKFDIYQLEVPEEERATISSERDGFQSQKKQNKKEDPGYVIKSKKSHPSPASMVDIPAAQDSSKRAILDQSLPFPELAPENADFKMGSEKTPGLRDSLFGITKVKAISNGSIIDGKSQGDHFKVRIANDAHQKAPRSSERAISALTALLDLDPNAINEQLIKGMPYQDITWQREVHSRDSSSPDFSSRNNGMIGVKKSSPDSISRDLERANIFRIGSMIAQSEAYLIEPQKRQFPPQSNGERSTIRVTIGRIEVRAERPHHVPSAPLRSAPPSRRLSLDEYLKKRSTGQI